MATRVTARDGRGLGSRVSRLRRSRARALLSLNLKKKRDCSQSSWWAGRVEIMLSCNFSQYNDENSDTLYSLSFLSLALRSAFWKSAQPTEAFTDLSVFCVRNSSNCDPCDVVLRYFSLNQCTIKQLLDSVLFGIIVVSVSVIIYLILDLDFS